MLLRHHLVLHDAGMPPAAGEAMHGAVVAQFGPTSCTMLVINSRHSVPPPAATPPLSDIWTAAREARLGPAAAAASAARLNPLGVVAGAALTRDDVARVTSFMSDFAAQQVIPFLENKVVQLSAHIGATRKGLRNTLKSLWRGTSKEPRSWELPPQGAYPHSQPEAQIRLCADLALMLRDTDTAVGHLRLVAPDFRADRAWRQLGAAQEALGLALVCGGDGSSASLRREVDAAFEAACSAHRNAAPPLGPRLAIRTALLHAWAVASLRDGRAAAAAAVPLARAAGESSSHGLAAHLLEASAACLLAAQPPRMRRATLHAVLAGHRHTLAGARGGAVRAYAVACALLGGTASQQQQHANTSPQWRAAQAHVHLAMARHLAHSGGAMVEAMEHLVALSRMLDASADGDVSNHNPASDAGLAVQHGAFLRELLYVAATAKTTAWEVAVPMLDTRHVRVHAEDARGFGNDAARRVPEDAWAVVEGSPAATAPGGSLTPVPSSASLASLALSASGDGPASSWLTSLVPPDLATTQSGTMNWLDGAAQSRASGAGADTRQWAPCLAGEQVTVHVKLVNPLATPITVDALCLEATFWEGDAAGSDAAFTASNGRLLACAAHAFTLEPCERREVALCCTPPAPGRLNVTAATWRLLVPGLGDSNGTGVPCRATFAVAAPLRRRGPAGTWLPDVPLGSRLLFRVGPPMPRLRGELAGIPDAVPQGALMRCVLRLSNDGASPLGRLRLAASHACVVPGGAPLTSSAADAWTWDDVHNDTGVAPQHLLAVNQASPALPGNSSGGRPAMVFAFPDTHATLQPGTTLAWPLWVHAHDASALQSLRLSVLYAPTTTSGAPSDGTSAAALRYRVLRLCAAVTIHPCVEVAALLGPGKQGVSTPVVGLTVTHKGGHAVRAVRLRSLSLLPPARTRGTALHPLGKHGAAMCALPGDGAVATAFLALVPCEEEHSGAKSVPQHGNGHAHGSVVADSPDVALTAGGEVRAACTGVLGVLYCAGETALPDEHMPRDVPMAMLWEADCAGLTRGMTLITASWRPAGSGASESPQTPSVTATLQGPSTCCVGDVLSLQVVVHNAGPVPVACRLALGGGGSEHGGQWARIPASDAHPDAPVAAMGLPGSAQYMWLGVTKTTVAELAAGGTCCLPAKLLVLAPGVHNLHRWHVSWRPAADVGAAHAAAVHTHFVLSAEMGERDPNSD